MGSVVDLDAGNGPLMPLHEVRNLAQLLVRAAGTDRVIEIYNRGAISAQYKTDISYADLLRDARAKAASIAGLASPSSTVLLHFDNHNDNVCWFWACIMAGVVPALSTPFVSDVAQRKKHILHLQNLLEKPVILTSEMLVPEFLDIEGLKIHSIEALGRNAQTNGSSSATYAGIEKDSNDISVLMLTSGSTGSCKAVVLRHGQQVTSLRGKIKYNNYQPTGPILTWIGFDHVAHFETSFTAMALCADQVLVHASDLLPEPLEYLRLIDRHRVYYTFSPHFFLAKISDALETAGPSFQVDLSSLQIIGSGGESNVVSTCTVLTRQLARFGAPEDVIRTAFGLTETHGGFTYHDRFPADDLARGYEFGSVGRCMPGSQIRIMRESGDGLAGVGEVGMLQLFGAVVFREYLNNPSATQDSFTADGWFVTGDRAFLDDAGNLNVAGRVKENINVSGVKWSCLEIETAIEEEGIPGLVPSWTASFPTRAPGEATEQIAIAYRPAYDDDDDVARYNTVKSISKAVSSITGQAPSYIIPAPPAALIEKTSLGKISRALVRANFEKGMYSEFQQKDAEALKRYKAKHWKLAETRTEKLLQEVLADMMDMDPNEIDMNMSIFDLGISSINLIQGKALIEQEIELRDGKTIEIPMSILMMNPTLTGIAKNIEEETERVPYNAVVPLQLHGDKTPLFCMHPGSGDMLVFIGLATFFSTRPIYALRTMGHNPGEDMFPSLEIATHTYVDHILQVQPEGPYAITGYSLGSMFAFEISKELVRRGKEVKFTGVIDYPPNIAEYVSRVDWADGLRNIAAFFDFIDDDTMDRVARDMHQLYTGTDGPEFTKDPLPGGREKCLEYVLKASNPERVAALSMNVERLGQIADIAENFRKDAAKYKPEGKLPNLDVFIGDPPRYAAPDRPEWRKILAVWDDFSEEQPVYHECEGPHTKMLNTEHVASFSKKLKAALKVRGL